MDITSLLQMTIDEGASDLHLSAGAPAMLRVHGHLKHVTDNPLTPEEIHTMLFDILTDSQKARFQESLEIDFSLELTGLSRFRVNVFNQRRGEGAVFRVIPTNIKSVKERLTKAKKDEGESLQISQEKLDKLHPKSH